MFTKSRQVGVHITPVSLGFMPVLSQLQVGYPSYTLLVKVMPHSLLSWFITPISLGLMLDIPNYFMGVINQPTYNGGTPPSMDPLTPPEIRYGNPTKDTTKTS